MFWWWGPWGWIAGLIGAAFWIALIVGAVVLLRRELPAFQHRMSSPPALRMLEERYARGEINREEFLHRRDVLLAQPPIYQSTSPSPPSAPEPPPNPSPGAEPTDALPPTDELGLFQGAPSDEPPTEPPDEPPTGPPPE